VPRIANPATTESLAVVSCTECGRVIAAGERWSLRFVDLAEVAAYCLECDEQEFGDQSE
jgi:RNase P subunit RPR2